MKTRCWTNSILAGGESLAGPERMVPVAAREPVAGGLIFGKGSYLGQHFRQRLNPGQVHVELGLAGPAQVGVSVVQAWET